MRTNGNRLCIFEQRAVERNENDGHSHLFNELKAEVSKQCKRSHKWQARAMDSLVSVVQNRHSQGRGFVKGWVILDYAGRRE